MKIDTADLVGVTEIAEAFKVERNVIGNWMKRYESFPQPIRVLACGSLWRMSDVRGWYEARTNTNVVPLHGRITRGHPSSGRQSNT